MQYRDETIQRLNYLNQIIASKMKSLSTAPEGRIDISKRNGTTQYYQAERGKKKGSYIHTADLSLAKALAQKFYDQLILKKAMAEKIPGKASRSLGSRSNRRFVPGRQVNQYGISAADEGG